MWFCAYLYKYKGCMNGEEGWLCSQVALIQGGAVCHIDRQKWRNKSPFGQSENLR